MRGTATRHAKPDHSVQAAKTDLKALLLSCTDKALASHTPERLARMYRVAPTEAAKVKYCEYELLVERERRKRRAAEANLNTTGKGE